MSIILIQLWVQHYFSDGSIKYIGVEIGVPIDFIFDLKLYISQNILGSDDKHRKFNNGSVFEYAN